jgi:hypothetical protein
MNPTHRKGEKIQPWKHKEKINLSRQIDEQMRSHLELNTTKITKWKGLLYLSIIILNINGLNSSIKRHRLADFLKSKPQPFLAYKKHTSLIKTNTDWKWKDGKRFSIQTQLQSKPTILISDKADFLHFIRPHGIKQTISNKRNYRKYLNTWKLSNSLLNDQWSLKK